ncbi:unnamed protein product, partial [Brenthis ino]
MGIREACRIYGVPKTTVHDRISGKVANNKKPKVGPDPILGREGEEKLKTWVLDMAKCGFPINKKELLESVANIVRDTNIKNPFKDGVPGDTWYQAFLRRHPDVNVREPEGINNARAAVTENRVRFWFKDLKEYMKSIDALDVFDNPTRIFNGDETGFSLCPKSGKVLGPRGYKNLYIIKKTNDKENISVLIVFSADGKICPPLVIFPYVRPPKTLIESMPPTWILGRSESGWMKSDVFFEYISNSFHTWLIKNEIKKPVLLFVDGHKSHMTYALSQFCETNGIILYALPPNTTHMLQPADVSVFRPLKQEWKKTVKNWQARDENVNQTVTKINFCKILNETLTNIDLRNAIVNGFRKCGLYPLNEDAVDYTKCIKDIQQRKRVSNTNQKTISGRDYDTATKVITQIKEELSRHSVDTKVVLAEIEKAKMKYISNRRSKSKTPRTSATSNVSTSILVEDLLPMSASSPKQNIQNAELRTDACLYTEEEDSGVMNFLDPGSFISLNNISILPIGEVEISQDNSMLDNFANNQSISLTTVAEIHNKNDFAEADHHQPPPRDVLAAITDNVSLNPAADTYNVKDFVEAENQQPPVVSLTDNITFTTTTSFDEVFEKHLRFPESESSSAPKARTGLKLPSAISSGAWRKFYENKEKEKENKIITKKIKQVLRADAKEKKAKEKDSKVKEKKKVTVRSTSKKMLKRSCQNKAIKCSQCSDDLISDVEDDAEKNIGCDHCARWFHLKCTVLKQTPYVEAAQSDYTCPFCKHQ